MKQIGLWIALLAASLLPAAAQVTVEVTLPQEQFLPGEAVVAGVRIINRSGQTLHMGEQEDWLKFSVEARADVIITRSGEPPVAGAFTLGSSQRATKRVDLAPYFSLTRPGRYSIVATVYIREWDREVTSAPRSFDVIQGAKLWEQEFGVPRADGASNDAPEVRKYILQEANHLKGELKLYLRVTDASGAKVFRVCPIGQMLSFSKPEHQMDRSSNLHVLYANGPQAYLYTVFDPNGAVLEKQIYDYADTRPRLLGDEEGKVSVIGGVRRVPVIETTAEPAEPVKPVDDVAAPKS